MDAVAGVQLGQEVRHVCLDCACRDVEPGGDLAVRQSFGSRLARWEACTASGRPAPPPQAGVEVVTGVKRSSVRPFPPSRSSWVWLTWNCFDLDNLARYVRSARAMLRMQARLVVAIDLTVNIPPEPVE